MIMIPRGPALRWACSFSAVSLALAGACGDGPQAPAPLARTATLRVSAFVTGATGDPNGFAVRVDDHGPRALAGGAAIEFADLVVGTHSVILLDVDEGCIVEGDNPRDAVVVFPVTSDLAFSVICATPGTGAIRATVAAPGINRFQARVDDGPWRQAASGGEIVLPGLVPGAHEVTLETGHWSCRAGSDNPLSVRVVADGIADVAFPVVCDPGHLLVTVSTTGPNRPVGYNVVVLEASDLDCVLYNCWSERVGASGTIRFDGLSSVPHVVSLVSRAANCAVVGAFRRTVRVDTAAPAVVEFTVNCE